MRKQIQKNKGFTLLELIIVIAILAILSTILIPVVNGYIEKAKIATDTTNLRTLNNVSQLYRINFNPIPEELFSGLTSDTARMNALVTGGFLVAPIAPKQEDQSFAWVSETQQWTLSVVRIPTVLTGMTIRRGTLMRSYNGTDFDLVMPLTLNGNSIFMIDTRVFQNKGLTSVYFDPASEITRIYSYAFADNNLTEVIIPASINRLDRGVFQGNPLTKVTIGSDIYIRDNSTIPNNFKTYYDNEGAGTYLLINGIWVKQ